ncbi:DNA-binding transcriptional regulator LsrR (DeoR family) [Scopulibacillus darangshiensis]|uniref:DNA-binding transcriptional regulator LsrR (DeoR family) n=1 Tax=Scopulibacillus darangshiensis TaxID=442528 RepID=A0A4R2P6G0_9BACL|nr:sugar-binding transcriptional regulator [Scopulibacillus darangshiensis]TCP29571.1 DNA-binding transcriptional regulator LsrR (DeoR family) [Scopulibacillus darangshiensis]
MKTDDYAMNLMIKVAWYYYKDQLTQSEIAELLDLSRNKVVRLLDKARTEGIVQINIKGNGTNCLGIENQLKETFQLANAFVIPTPKKNLSESLGKAAAQYIEGKLEPNDLIGLGWGEAVSHTIEHLSIEPNSEVSLVTLTGGVNYYLQKGGNLGDGGLDKFHGRIHIIPAPFLASTANMAQSLLSEPSVGTILDLALLSKYVIVGVGGLKPDATLIREEKMTINEFKYMEQQGAVGDILGQFFEENGKELQLPHHERLIGTSITKLREMKNVIAVAGGASKIDAIGSALRGGYIQTLITDEKTASSLISKEVDQHGLYSGV